ncbi:hypothetical protein FHS19_006970 [Paenibacillus rhizosphaerae]|uniref:TniQ domain-containing protein n=1 Tax=Paenibacillus rhizosphaerae TaxID=297318 RepID=A0A839U0L8_9BACL|nr:TniQ family protein [Paenibacillus rhizosphaerae]MBB3132241.1 hypothetical protein [Paenibacillus rhizosphaerae]
MIVWKSEWVNVYETPWSIFEKLCFANHITRTDVIRTLGSKEIQQIKNVIIGDKWRELIKLSGFDHQMLHNYIGFNIADQINTDINLILKPIEYIYENILTWFPKSIRWCPDCMSKGYHSWVHQFTLTQQCPYHANKIINSCPNCSNEIPFLLSDRSMDEPFTCTCGYKLAEFSHWREWNQNIDIKDPSMAYWLKGAGRSNTERFIFDPITVGLNLFNSKPTIMYKTIHRATNKRRYLDQLFTENINCFKAIDRYIHKKYLKRHKMCISSFQELLKLEQGDFPPICPYAYAYVLWKHTLLQTSTFYNNSKHGDLNEYDGKSYVTKLFKKNIDYIKKILSSQLNLSDIDSRPVFHQILNRYTTELLLNYFHQWLAIAEKGARLAVAPKWKQINEMIEMSLPSIIFKLDADLGKKIDTVQVYYKNNRLDLPISLVCTNSSSNMKNEIRKMTSFIPSMVAMRIFDNPTQENKLLREYVDNYVDRFSF